MSFWLYFLKLFRSVWVWILNGKHRDAHCSPTHRLLWVQARLVSSIWRLSWGRALAWVLLPVRFMPSMSHSKNTSLTSGQGREEEPTSGHSMLSFLHGTLPAGAVSCGSIFTPRGRRAAPALGVLPTPGQRGEESHRTGWHPLPLRDQGGRDTDWREALTSVRNNRSTWESKQCFSEHWNIDT